MKISTVKSFLNYAVEIMGQDFDVSEISLADDLNLRVKIQGESWDGFIDYRIAKFVKKIQQDIFSIYNEIHEGNYDFRKSYSEVEPYVIKVRVERGCTEIVIKIVEIFNELISNIKDKKKQAVLISLLLLSFGYIPFRVYNDAVTERMRVEADENTKREIAQVASNALELSKQCQRGMIYLFGQLANDDRITVENIYADLDRDAAFDRLGSGDLHKSEKSINIDDEYLIIDYNFEKKRITLKKSGVKFNALTKSLDDSSLHELHELTKKADLNDTIPLVSLLVTATISEGHIKDAYVVGLGSRRDSAISVKDAIEVKKEKKRTIEQLKLLE